MKYQAKLTSRQQEQVKNDQQQTRQQTACEFASVEEMLRHDALHTLVPPAVGHRLQASLNREPKPKVSWWQRFFPGP
jgi:hypothetical protein